ncbi:ATP-binding cassette domain-containing protein [Spongiactinospora gelatinilytica]|uniref:ATP-binding cassette domain-containing protein n=1 Tax=Spongiactinospora gelatinilytica TaxID=2666298 RepID=UPI001F439978|nr:ABC transporter ATP-binding protein [Spongiactinospora gelatinilytica]
MLSIALGLVAQDAGQVALLGDAPRAAVRAGKVGVLSQDGGLIEDVRVAELVAAVAGMYPSPLPVREALRAAGVEELAARRVRGLSGGQRQRVRFALALVGDPRLLVLDEPTVGLDVEGRRGLWQEVKRRTTGGGTVMFATHYLAEADDHADRIVLVVNGRIIADGDVAQIKSMVGDGEIRLTLDRPAPGLLAGLPGVRAVAVEGTGVALTTDDSDATLRALFAAFDDVRDVRTVSLDLESAFVRLTGEAGS